MAQQVPQLPSRSGNTDWTLYNWFSRLSTSLKNFYDEVYTFIASVPGSYLSKAGDTGNGDYIFDGSPGSVTINGNTYLNGSAFSVGGLFIESLDGTSASYLILAEDTTGNLLVGEGTDVVFGYDLAAKAFQVNSLNLIGSGQRITGDFSNATPSLRTSIKSSTTNGATIMQVVPNGTSQASYYFCANTSDPDNTAYVYMGHTSTSALITTGKVGTGTVKGLSFYPNGVHTLNLSTAGLATFYGPVVYATQYTHTTTTGTTTIDFNNAQNIKLTQSGNVTLSFTFPGIGHFYLTIVHGANTVVWPTIGASFQWLGSASDPALNAGTYGGLVELFYNGTMTVAKYTKIGA